MPLGTGWTDNLSPYAGEFESKSLTQRRKVAKITKIAKEYLPLRALRLGVRIKLHHFNIIAKILFIRPPWLCQVYEQTFHGES